jgi:hypothetical protein
MRSGPAVIVALCAALNACTDITATGGFLPPKVAPLTQGNPKDRGPRIAPPRAQPPAGADAFARDFLNGLQARSFADRSEYCGYFLRSDAGGIIPTTPSRGRFAECEYAAVPAGAQVFASYHTHGAYGADYDNEVPSVTDLLSDFDFGVNGYVSTPGGRVWKVDLASQSTVQICGLGCVLVDPDFVPNDEAGVQRSYTLAQLSQRQRGN